MTSTAAGPIGMAFFLFIDCKPHKLVPVVPLRIPTLSRTLISSLFALPATWVYGIYIIASLVFRSLVQVINILKLPTRRRNLAPRSARSQSTPNPTSPRSSFPAQVSIAPLCKNGAHISTYLLDDSDILGMRLAGNAPRYVALVDSSAALAAYNAHVRKPEDCVSPYRDGPCAEFLTIAKDISQMSEPMICNRYSSQWAQLPLSPSILYSLPSDGCDTEAPWQ